MSGSALGVTPARPATGIPQTAARRVGRLAAAAALLAADVAASAVVLWAVVVTPAARAGDATATATVLAFVLGTLGLATVGALVVVRRPEQQRIGWLLLAVGATGAWGRAVIGLALASPSRTPDLLAWATNWAWVPCAVAVLVVVLRFPTGDLPSPRWRVLEGAAVAWGGVAVVATALVPGPLAVTPLDRHNPYGVVAAPWLVDLLSPLFALLPLLMLLAGASVLVRYRRSTLEERQQLRWVAAAVGVLAVTAPLAAVSRAGEVLEGAAYLLLPAALAVAVLRHRLYDLGLVVRRTLAYALACAVLLALYVGTVAVLQSALRGRTPDVVATAAVAVAAVPVLGVVQRAVERLLFGDRRDPDRVVRQLAQQLASTPEELLPRVAHQVAHSLRLPYVAIELADGSVPAAVGVPAPGAQRVPLRHGGQLVGHLVAGRRTPHEPLGGRDVALLQRVAEHAGLAVHNSHLTAALQQTADRLQVARAEERARLQRDLHDELGPALGAVGMRTEAARNLLRRGDDAARVDAVLESVERAAETAVAEVRRILAELQPQVLEEHGLDPALREVARAVPEGVAVELDLQVPVGLPPRVELAAYRIAAEALRNAVRHAAPRRVRLSVGLRERTLVLTVGDDGCGLPERVEEGVGMGSMRARAAELGGSLEVATGATGTTVTARLPVDAR